MISKWSKYQEEVSKMLNESVGIAPTTVARTILESHGLPYDDMFRLWISRFRKKVSLPPAASKPVKTSAGSTSYEENLGKGEANWEYKGDQVITTLNEALKFSDVDLKKWEVERHVFNSWDVTMKGPDGEPIKSTNYQVKVWFKQRSEADEGLLIEFRDKVSKALASRKASRKIRRKSTSGKIGFVPVADLHIGAYIRDLIVTQNFDVDTVIAMLDEVADEINDQGYSEVHVAIIGDVIESFTGKNHPNSFQSIGYGQTGFSVFITAYEILENFLLGINNLKKVYCVSGNHDRYSASNKEDVKGEILQGLSYFLDKHLDVEIEYNPIVITAVIDGICYIITHGHHGFSQKNIEKIILDYGIQGLFNVVVMGHFHSRRKKDTLIRVETIMQDSAKYRGYVCPSLFTGNFFSEALGFSSTAGFLQFWSKNDIPACLDTPVG